MVRATRDAGRQLRSESASRAALELFAALIALGGLLASPFIYVAWRADTWPVPVELQAIPISARACPEVQAIQSAAQSFENVWNATEVSVAPWSVSQIKLERSLDVLDRTLGALNAVVPAQVRVRLSDVLMNVRRGEHVVVNSTTIADVLHRGYVELNAAFSSYGDAETLVGDACGSLYVYTGPPVPPSRSLTKTFAGIANWVCGPQRNHCPTTTTTSPRSDEQP